MQTEIISIGTELLLGKVNTNASYLSEKITGIGLNLIYETTVGDNKANMAEAFRQVFKRAHVVFITGGLGPTFDDLTREVIAEVLEKKLVFSREAMQSVAAFFAKRGQEMPKKNEKQAYYIEGARLIPNEIGTAPGQIIELAKHQDFAAETIILLPGPQFEIEPMMNKVVLPFLKEKYERGLTKLHIMHVAGMSESKVDEEIKEQVEIERKLEGGDLRFALVAHPGIVDVVIIGSGKNEMLIDGFINKAKRELKEKLGSNIFGENDESLAQVTGNLMGRKKMTVSIAESCTAGLLSKMITDVSGSSMYFKGGVVAYNNLVKKEVLGVSLESLENQGAVSRQVALEMAKGVRKLCRSSIGIGITGIAGPGGGTPEKPVGLVYCALVTDQGELCNEQHFAGNRRGIREKAAIYALDMLRRLLLQG
ncbi:MAG: competence/damage-inducible protein A [bacterium]|nr:competence/damage-inducible protein A [bacterium]MDD5756353.1 competence/damage-inducible protein A [bacterium]